MSTTVQSDVSANGRMTPLMRQYFQFKQELGTALLLMQVGDFYELFFQDAHTASKILNITLTSMGTFNDKPIPMCGIPMHAVDAYVGKLLQAGHTVAIIDQQEKAVAGKLVSRGVSQLLTPATIMDDHLLPASRSRSIAALAMDATQIVLVRLEPLRGLLSIIQESKQETQGQNVQAQLHALLTIAHPDELLVQPTKDIQAITQNLGIVVHEDVVLQDATEWFQHLSVQPTGLIRVCLQRLYSKLQGYHKQLLFAVNSVVYEQPQESMLVDASTLQNLDIITADESKPNLINTLDATMTTMGARALRSWLLRPLQQPAVITQRLDAVQWLKEKVVVRAQLRELLNGIGDIERPIGRLAAGKPTINDMRRLIPALYRSSELYQLLLNSPELLQRQQEECQNLEQLAQLLQYAIAPIEQAPNIIAQGFNAELDQARALTGDVGARIAQFEAEQQIVTGIPSLKVRYNGAHGYSIEITNTHKALVPAHYQRQQTLVGRERYIIPELLQLQHDITHATARVQELETALWQSLVAQMRQHIVVLRRYAQAVATIDVLTSFASTAADRNYIRPIFTHEKYIKIVQGKHPIVAAVLGTKFIANDIALDDKQRVAIVTGPNMGGKSTYLRQAALLTYMAHCGCYVPANEAIIPYTDRLYTRIGAGDNLAAGKSTFLIEMEETAAICRNSTRKSLIILDEVGRGTSTQDGLALATAIVEYIADTVGCFCLFATHYHELASLADGKRPIQLLQVMAKQLPDRLLFFHEVMPGASNSSFGIAVAQLAGVPEPIIARAKEILSQG